MQCRAVTVLDFHCLIIIAKRIHDNDIIAMSRENLKNDKSYQLNPSLTLFKMCFVSFLANELVLSTGVGMLEAYKKNNYT